VSDPHSLLRNLPRVDELLSHPLLAHARAEAPHILLRDAIREAVEAVRARIVSDIEVAIDNDAIVQDVLAILQQKLTPSLRRAVNATGVILHTGLGRTPLSEAAQAALVQVTSGYCNVQSDVGSGERMPREVHVESLLQQITGAEAAAVVNNNAAATVLVLNTFAAGREVIVSRGEMVEIGGAFRIPDIIRLSGCRLLEVGCTNRTHLRDYRNAITSETALLLAVHQSNYRITGFTAQPTLAELSALAREHTIACAHDLGSGALLDLSAFGLPHEPTVQESLAAGAEVVFFSGDKLVGGPQCGIILGKAPVIEKMRKNPFYRTFRVDKLILTALEATLRLFLDPERLPQRHRLLGILTCPVEQVRERAKSLADEIAAHCAGWLQVDVCDAACEIGGGSLAGHTIPSVAVRLRSRAIGMDDLASRLRLTEPPVFTRVQEDAVWLDMRTMLGDEPSLVVGALEKIGSPFTKRY
jgi:L-seryl-tRNA(Ser) seleniumtransferase